MAALLTAATLFFSAAASAMAAPALWVVQSNVGKVYLFGTVHLLRDGTPWRSPELEAAIKESQDLYLEIADIDNTSAALTSVVKVGFDRDHPLSTKIPKSDVTLLSDVAKRYGYGSEAAFEPMRPWLAFMLVSILPAIHSGYSSGNSVDLQIRKEFAADKKPIYGFETFAQQAHFFADMPEADQVELLDAALRNAGKQAKEAALDEIVRVWLSGNQDALAELLHTQTSMESAFEKRLLTDRNEAWATALAQRLKQPGTSFVSVGAAHLVGSDGVPALLGRMGFTVSRVSIAQAASPVPSPASSPPATGLAPPTAAQTTPPSPASNATSPSPAPTPVPLTLTPPPGWKVRSISLASGAFKADRLWVDPKRGAAMMAAHLDLPGITATDLDTLDTLFHQGLIAGVGAKGSVQLSTRVKVCNGKQDATYTKVKLATVSEDVVLTVSDRGYLAEYVRGKGLPDDPAAIKSLLSLCAP